MWQLQLEYITFHLWGISLFLNNLVRFFHGLQNFYIFLYNQVNSSSISHCTVVLVNSNNYFSVPFSYLIKALVNLHLCNSLCIVLHLNRTTLSPEKPTLAPLAVQHLDNRLYMTQFCFKIMQLFTFIISSAN